MKYGDPNHPVQHRARMRLQGYDYSKPGTYFVTVVTQDRKCLFGEIRNDEMRLNDAGEMLRETLERLHERFQSIGVEQSVVMPNHIHGLIVIENSAMVSTRDTRPDEGEQGPTSEPSMVNRAATRAAPTLSDVIGAFKSMTTVEYIRGVKSLGWPAFQGRLWQSNYYDRVVRNERDLQRIRQYILENPLKWALDTENPANRS